MMRVFFLFEDPLDEAGINLSFIDVPTRDPAKAFARVENAARSGELWKNLYPDRHDQGYKLIESKMMHLDISKLTSEWRFDTVLPM